MKEDLELAISKLESKDPETRGRAIEEIGLHEAKGGVKHLLKALDDEVVQNRVNAAYYLSRKEGLGTPDAVLKALHDSDKAVRIYAAGIIVKAGENGVEILADFLLGCNGDERNNVLFSIGKDPSFEKKIIKAMRQELEGEDASRRIHAALVLGELHYQLEPVIKALEKGLSAEDELIQDDSFQMLSKWGLIDEDRLISEIQSADSKTKIGAIKAIGNSKNAAPAIIAALGDEDKGVRKAAAEALGGIGSKKAVKPLVKMLREDTAACKQAAAMALGEIGDERAIGPLLEALDDEGLDTMVQVYGPCYDPSNYAALALEKFGEKAVEPLIEALDRDEYDETMLYIATTLGHIGDKRALKPLRKFMKTLDSDAVEVVEKAIKEIS